MPSLGDTKQQIKDIILSSPSMLTLTTDGWSAITTDPFVVVTCHFIDKDWEMHELALAFFYMPEAHTIDNLVKRTLDVFTEYGILGKVRALVSDNASNAHGSLEAISRVLAAQHNNPGVLAIRCLPHILHLVVLDGLAKISGAITKVRAMVTKIHKSNSLKLALKRFCEAREIRFRLPPTDCETRWSSTFNMLEVMNSMKQALSKSYFLVGPNNHNQPLNQYF